MQVGRATVSAGIEQDVDFNGSGDGISAPNCSAASAGPSRVRRPVSQQTFACSLNFRNKSSCFTHVLETMERPLQVVECRCDPQWAAHHLILR